MTFTTAPFDGYIVTAIDFGGRVTSYCNMRPGTGILLEELTAFSPAVRSKIYI